MARSVQSPLCRHLTCLERLFLSWAFTGKIPKHRPFRSTYIKRQYAFVDMNMSTITARRGAVLEVGKGPDFRITNVERLYRLSVKTPIARWLPLCGWCDYSHRRVPGSIYWSCLACQMLLSKERGFRKIVGDIKAFW